MNLFVTILRSGCAQFSGRTSTTRIPAGRRTANPQGRAPKSLILWACLAGLTGLLTQQEAQAGFTGAYSYPQYTLTLTDESGFALLATDPSYGYAYSPDGGLTMVIVGGNNGSGIGSTTDFTATAAQTGMVQFQYLFSTADQWAGYDFSGFLVGDVFNFLSEADGASGTTSFQILEGERFGFRVVTLDNVGEPGILTISSFTAPQADSASVPEPSMLPLLTIVVVAAAVLHNRSRRIQPGNGVQA